MSLNARLGTPGPFFKVVHVLLILIFVVIIVFILIIDFPVIFGTGFFIDIFDNFFDFFFVSLNRATPPDDAFSYRVFRSTAYPSNPPDYPRRRIPMVNRFGFRFLFYRCFHVFYFFGRYRCRSGCSNRHFPNDSSTAGFSTTRFSATLLRFRFFLTSSASRSASLPYSFVIV